MRGINKKSAAKADRNAWSDKAAGKIAGATIKVQTGFAATMNRLASSLPRRTLKGFLFAFCLAGSGFSTYLAAHAVLSGRHEQPAIELRHIRIPRHYDQTGSAINEAGNQIPEALYRDIQHYKRSMDSLGQSIRPGLRDSIQVLERRYHLQNIK